MYAKPVFGSDQSSAKITKTIIFKDVLIIITMPPIICKMINTVIIKMKMHVTRDNFEHNSTFELMRARKPLEITNPVFLELETEHRIPWYEDTILVLHDAGFKLAHLMYESAENITYLWNMVSSVTFELETPLILSSTQKRLLECYEKSKQGTIDLFGHRWFNEKTLKDDAILQIIRNSMGKPAPS